MEILAAVARRKGAPLSLETLNLEPPRPNEILVKVAATGICHTDLVVIEGLLPTPLPVVLGHEGSGIVAQIGHAISKVAVGDHVVMTFNSCGRCPSCQDNARSYCHDFFPRNLLAARSDGSGALTSGSESIHSNFFGQSSFANYALCHEANVVKVADDVPLPLLGPLACGIQTDAGAVMNALKVTAGESFGVFGAGSVGLAAVMAARVVGATTIIAIDVNASRLTLAKELGATHTVNVANARLQAQVRDITGSGLNAAVDTTGLPAVIRAAVDNLAPRGRCGIVGAAGPDAEITLNETHFMTGGRCLMGIVEGSANPDVFIPKLITLYREGLFPFDKLVQFYDFAMINDAINDSAQGRVVKPVVRFH